MDPGDLVLYESAKCIHGRPEPMMGLEKLKELLFIIL